MRTPASGQYHSQSSTGRDTSGAATFTDDLISELIRAEDDGDRLTADELRMLAEVLLMAGTDTTRNQLAAVVQDLCDCSC